MTRPLRVLFLAHPRSGSSSLYEILQLHPALNILEEPFNENFTRWDAGNKNYLELVYNIPSLEAQTVEIFESYSGIKILDYQLPLDIADIQQRVAEMKIRLDFFESVVDERPIHETVKLTYEELYFVKPSRLEEQVNAIWDILGLPPLKLEYYQTYIQPETAKINSAATYAFLPNAQEIDKACGDDETGWLYDTHSRY